MNAIVIESAKKELKELLSLCTEPQVLLFKRMYCHKNLDFTVDQAVDQMTDINKISRALDQVQATLAKRG